MTVSAKTPLQDVVSTICDTLANLPPDDQTRALEAVRLTLGLGAAVTLAVSDPAPVQEIHVPQVLMAPEPRALWEPSLFQEPPARLALPTVVVQMMGDRPMVVGQQASRSGRSLVVVGPQRDQRRQLPSVHTPDAAPDTIPAQLPSGSRRGGYVRSIR